MMECWNAGMLGRRLDREGRRIAVLAVDPTALPKRERRRPLRQSHSVRPSRLGVSRNIIPLFHHSNFPGRLTYDTWT